ncbi:MAG TPA: xanthine dehydrogenase family protein subunit M, partial [Xanthobacteraceae bacterium]|nr:xanthine dehydrogenase family protein subunit M [Xanthobacteraceae bacterium]
MHTFAYHRPATTKQAAALLAKKDTKALAGGQTLLPALKLRLASIGNVVDLGAIKGLDDIAVKGKTLVIGAMARHAVVADSSAVKKALPALAKLAEAIGDPHVRNMGTIGGSLANNDPSADYPAAVLALNATIVTNKRKIPADKFFKGLFETALGRGEFIVQVIFPIPKRAAYAKFPNPASRFAMVGVFVADHGKDVRVAVTGASEDGVFRAKDMEAALKKKFAATSVDGIKVPSKGIMSDIHADRDYRAHLVGVMAKRAVAAAGG